MEQQTFETARQQGFTRHLLCDIGEVYPSLDSQPVFDFYNKGITRVLSLFRWSPPPPEFQSEQLPRPLHLISTSSRQLRHVLEDRLLATGLDWSCDIFRSPSEEMSLVIYKSLALLQIMETAAANDEFYLIGANTPLDVFILLGSKMFTCGMLTVTGYSRFLQLAGEDISPYHAYLHKVGSRKISRILILEPHRPLFTASNPLQEYLTVVADFGQIFWLLLAEQIINAEITLETLMPLLHNQLGLSREEIVADLRYTAEQLGNAELKDMANKEAYTPAAREPDFLRNQQSSIWQRYGEEDIIDMAKELIV